MNTRSKTCFTPSLGKIFLRNLWIFLQYWMKELACNEDFYKSIRIYRVLTVHMQHFQEGKPLTNPASNVYPRQACHCIKHLFVVRHLKTVQIWISERYLAVHEYYKLSKPVDREDGSRRLDLLIYRPRMRSRGGREELLEWRPLERLIGTRCVVPSVAERGGGGQKRGRKERKEGEIVYI